MKSMLMKLYHKCDTAAKQVKIILGSKPKFIADGNRLNVNLNMHKAF